MKQVAPPFGKSLLANGNKAENKFTTDNVLKLTANGLIRFEEKKEKHTWVDPGSILFVKSADHYVRSLIQDGPEKKWMTRHCTIKDLLAILNPECFVRLNRFYILNTARFSRIDEKQRTIYLDDDFSISAPHRISRYIVELLKQITVREMHFTK